MQICEKYCKEKNTRSNNIITENQQSKSVYRESRAFLHAYGNLAAKGDSERWRKLMRHARTRTNPILNGSRRLTQKHAAAAVAQHAMEARDALVLPPPAALRRTSWATVTSPSLPCWKHKLQERVEGAAGHKPAMPRRIL